MPGKVARLWPAFLLLMSFYTGDPVSGKNPDIEKLFQKASRLFNSPLPTDSTDKLALASFNQIIAENVRHPGCCSDSILFQSYLCKGVLLDVQLNYTGAGASYLQAIALQKKSRQLADSVAFRVYVYAGTSYYNLNNFDSANLLLLQAESIMNRFPDVPEKERLYSILGVLYYDNGNYLQSKNYFSRALDIIGGRHPYDSAAAFSIRTNMAAACYRLGQYHESLSMYNSLIQEHAASAYHGIPNYIYNNMGRANSALNHYGEAMACFRKVKKLMLASLSLTCGWAGGFTRV